MNAPHTASTLWPQRAVTEIPYALYTDPAVYALEQERLFRGPTWNFLGLPRKCRTRATSSPPSSATRRWY
jgi:hypothetical protein